jgi:NitT/TauT family transport system substrate-binding protein
LVTLVLVVVAVALTGWSASGATGATRGGAKAQAEEVKVGLLAASTLAPIYAGMKHGFFAEQGLELKTTTMNPPAVVPAVLSGDVKIGYLAIPSILLAVSKGLPLVIIANAGASPDSPVLVLENSPIKKYKDLAGKRTAIPNFGGLGQFAAVGALLNSGVKVDTAKMLVEVPFPAMETALRRGEVDAMWTIQPFAALALKRGGVRSLGSSVVQANLVGMGSAYFFTTTDTLKKEPQMIARFVKAVAKSNAYGVKHVDEMVQTVPTFANIPQEVLGPELVKAEYGAVPMLRLKQVNDFMFKHHFIFKSVNIKTLVWSRAWKSNKP